MANRFILLVVKTLKFWANGGQIGGQFNILKYQTYINQCFTSKKRAHGGDTVDWGKLIMWSNEKSWATNKLIQIYYYY